MHPTIPPHPMQSSIIHHPPPQAHLCKTQSTRTQDWYHHITSHHITKHSLSGFPSFLFAFIK